MGHDISASTHKQPISHYNNTLKKIPFQDNKNVNKTTYTDNTFSRRHTKIRLLLSGSMYLN